MKIILECLLLLQRLLRVCWLRVAFCLIAVLSLNGSSPGKAAEIKAAEIKRDKRMEAELQRRDLWKVLEVENIPNEQANMEDIPNDQYWKMFYEHRSPCTSQNMWRRTKYVHKGEEHNYFNFADDKFYMRGIGNAANLRESWTPDMIFAKPEWVKLEFKDSSGWIETHGSVVADGKEWQAAHKDHHTFLLQGGSKNGPGDFYYQKRKEGISIKTYYHGKKAQVHHVQWCKPQ